MTDKLRTYIGIVEAAEMYRCDPRHFRRIAEENKLTRVEFGKGKIPSKIMYLFAEVKSLVNKKD